MKRRYQKGDMGVTMLVIMVVMMLGGIFWHDRGGHMRATTSVGRTEKTAQELLDEASASGLITREEYLRKREDLLKR